MKAKWGASCSVGLLFVLTPAVHAANASLQLTALSLSLEPTTFVSPVPGAGTVTAYFTTYSPSRIPIYDTIGDYYLFSGELRPRVSMPGTYETDYLLSQQGNYAGYGYLLLSFPTADSNGNGLVDFMEVGRSISLSVSGSARADDPVGGLATVTGTFTRSAGSTQGNYNLFLTEAGYTSNFVAHVYLIASDPSNSGAEYSRGATNQISLQFRFRNSDGTLADASANTTFSVTNQNSCTLAAFTFVGPGSRIYSVPATTLTRSGTRYTGIASLQDGQPETSWADYRDWHIEINDMNDTDGDGIPDLTDELPPATTPPVITTQPIGHTVVAGANASLSVAATGTAPLSYQWRKDGFVIGGATGTSYTISNVQLADSGDYTVVVSNSAGSATSSSATLVVQTPPMFALHPVSQTKLEGETVTFSASATGTPSPSYQWRKDGIDIAGATGGTYAIAVLLASDAGSFSVRATNAAGAANSNSAILTVTQLPQAPAVTTHPQSFSIAVNGTITFTVESSGSPAPAFQWQRSTNAGATWSDVADGGAFAGSETASLRITNATFAMHGHRFRAVATNSEGSATSNAGTLNVAATTGARLINLSALAPAGAGDRTLVMGFFISGTGSKTLLIRGAGPTLAAPPFSRPGTVANPRLRVFNNAQQIIAENDDWDPSLAPLFPAVGAFDFVNGSADAAMTVTLTPGLYTVHIVNTGSEAEALIEVYDLSRDLGTRLTNLSCRFLLNPGQTLIVGTALIGGNVPLLVRNVGPELGLPPYNIPGVLADPHLELFAGSTSIGSNDDWEGSLAPFFSSVGAFPLTTGSKDAAVRQSITPGGYTVHATGKTGGGVAIVEIYESP